MHPMHSLCVMNNAPSAHIMHGERVPANVRAEVARRGLSQSALAAALNLTQSAVSRRLSGTVEFTASELAALAEHLQVPVSVFFDTPALAEGGDAA